MTVGKLPALAAVVYAVISSIALPFRPASTRVRGGDPERRGDYPGRRDDPSGAELMSGGRYYA